MAYNRDKQTIWRRYSVYHRSWPEKYCGMEQKNGQTEQGTAMPDRSDLERKRQMHNALCVKYAAAYCCDLKNAKSAVCGGKFTI